ncbi:MAG: hypothetical protein ACP6KW_13045, partial [Candidatus Thorarchaeota archaeon]
MEPEDTTGLRATRPIDTSTAQILVHEIFDHLHLERPSAVDFELMPPDTVDEPTATLRQDTITVRAYSEVEARKVICEEAVRQSWPPLKWMLAKRVGQSILVACAVYLTLFMLGVIIRELLPEGLVMLGDLLIVVLLAPPLYLLMRMPVWSEYARRELESRLLEVDGMAEYDAEYAFLDYSILIGFGYACMWCAVTFLLMTTSSYWHDPTVPIIATLVLSVLPSLIIPIAMISRNDKKYNRLREYAELSMFNEEDPHGMDSPEAEELRLAALDLARLLESEDFVDGTTGEFLPVEVAYHEIPSPPGRSCGYSFEDERVLLDIRDTSIDAAKRLLASTLVWKE